MRSCDAMPRRNLGRMSIAEPTPVAQPVDGPPLPMGRRVELPGRGTTFVREIPGPPGAPTVLLLHGWLASAGLNWFTAFDVLGERYRVLAPDLRGHGRGLRTRRRFTLADCADDTAALLDELGTGPVIAVGYSLGGPVAQLLWRRHPEHVGGLVLCATSHYLMPGMREQMLFGTFMLAAAGSTRLGMLAAQAPISRMRRLVPPGTPVRPVVDAGMGPRRDAPPRLPPHPRSRRRHVELPRPLDRPGRRPDRRSSSRRRTAPSTRSRRRAWRSRSPGRRSIASTTATSSAPSASSAPRSPPPSTTSPAASDG